ncbi:MAG TPA: PfkB family carbohydrate kinase [Chloroflexia bacterium]|nr:PfkB family carbohydrate kinase [Chloroflexia bacterium]
MSVIEVVGIGVATVDMITLVDHFPARREVQRALAMTLQGGGPVATALVTLARLGVKTAMVDAIGDDWRGALIRDELRREDVVVDDLVVRPGGTSAASCILVEQVDGARAIMHAPGTAAELGATEVPRSLVQAARVLHINGRHWEAALHAITLARAASCLVSFDGGADHYRPEMRELVPLTDICIVARDFAERYTGVTELDRAADVLVSAGPGLVVITDGRRGSWIHRRGERPFHQPAYLFRQTVDTTGCGDSYHGAFLFGLVRGMKLDETAALASAVAAMNSQQLGGRGGLPSLPEVQAFVASRAE